MGRIIVEKVKICGEEFEFESLEMENLYLAFREIKRIKESKYSSGEIGIVILNGKIQMQKTYQTNKATDKEKI